MRLNFFQRFLRFMFVPIAAMAAICMLRYLPIYKQIHDYCERRNTCSSACTSENFPELPCAEMELDLEYEGNLYTNFFVYPKPTRADNPLFEECAQFINDNPSSPYSVSGDTSR